ncbi:glycosyltransferase, partial [Candidatus Uhrbacteria bacterium]|nr:glycosyltransferase [Candidatus Uhrbacteria bacterium]
VGNDGNGAEEINNAIKNNPRIKKLGWVPLPELPSLISAAAAFVFSTFYEGFGLPILEALACQKLTLASDIEPIREIAGDAVIYFDPHNPAQMADVIGQALQSKDQLTTQLKPKWLETVKKFSWDNTARQTLAVLKAAAGLI